MNAMSNAERRNQRMNAGYAEGALISTRTYNLIMCGVVLFGLAVNAVICYFCGNLITYSNPLMFIVLYLVCCIAGTMIATKSNDPIVSFVGYCMVVVPVGLVVSAAVYSYGGLDSSVVFTAFLFTAVITATMMILGAAFPWFFAGLGRMLFAALIGLIVCELICIIFSIQQMVTSWIAAGIFSLYIGYDFARSQMFPKTADNAVDCALDIYLDIINLFLRLLSIFGSRDSGGSGRK